jgi:hypothetical protein
MAPVNHTPGRQQERVALAMGRALAACCHPVAAWRRGSAYRLPMVVGYVVAGYAVVLAALTFRN